MDEAKLLTRITVNPQIFGGKPIIRGRRLAVEHVLARAGCKHALSVLSDEWRVEKKESPY